QANWVIRVPTSTQRRINSPARDRTSDRVPAPVPRRTRSAASRPDSKQLSHLNQRCFDRLHDEHLQNLVDIWARLAPHDEGELSSSTPTPCRAHGPPTTPSATAEPRRSCRLG